MKIVASVRPTTAKTSHPLHAGFSMGGGASGATIVLTGEGSVAPGTSACGSLFTKDCGSNCGLSEVDRSILCDYDQSTGYTPNKSTFALASLRTIKILRVGTTGVSVASP